APAQPFYSFLLRTAWVAPDYRPGIWNSSASLWLQRGLRPIGRLDKRLGSGAIIENHPGSGRPSRIGAAFLLWRQCAMATRTTFRLLITAFCVFSLGPFSAFGWGVEGHQTVAVIAAAQLQGTNTATRISALLGALSLPDIALCPDEVRNLEEHHTTM